MWQTNPANTGQVLNKYSVIGVLHTAVENCLDRTNLIQSGFKRAGIYPWDTSAPDRSKLNPSKVYTHTDSPQSNPSSSEDTAPISSESASSTNSGLSSSSIDQPPAAITFTSAELSSSTDLTVSSSSQLLSFDPASFLSPEPSSSGYDVPADNGVPMEIECMVDLDTACDSIEDTFNREDTVTEDTSILSDISNFDPPLSSTINPGLNNKTYICSGCKKRILKRFEDIHSPNCIVTVQPSVRLNPVHDDVYVPSTLPVFSIEDRKSHLLKFEVLLLTPSQTEEFSKIFQNGLKTEEPIYTSWLALKSASIPTEEEAIDSVLSAHTANKVPKRVTKRKMNVPDGAERYDPSSTAWVNILKETEAKKQKQADSKAAKKAKNDAKVKAKKAVKPKATKSKKPKARTLR